MLVLVLSALLYGGPIMDPPPALPSEPPRIEERSRKTARRRGQRRAT